MQRRQIDAIDRKILAEMQRDGRVTVQDLAARIGLSASPCLRRIRWLEEAGILKGYVALVDQAKVRPPISVFASVKLERLPRRIAVKRPDAGSRSRVSTKDHAPR